MKKRILFMVINMNIGGTEKALLNMIREMSKEKYDITILMLEKYGGFLDMINDNIHLKYVKEYPEFKELLQLPPKIVVFNLIKKGRLLRATKLSFIYLLVKLTKNKAFLFEYILKNIPIDKIEYDIAIAYAGPMDFISYFVLNKIKAQKRFQWIHFDITKIGFDKHFINKYYSRFNKLYIVSKEAKQKFIQQFPDIDGKIETFHNLISFKEIGYFSNKGDGFNDNFNGIRILTVGRLAKEKGQDIAIEAFAELLRKGHNIRWYCIGDGDARQSYEELIDKYHLRNSFILLGSTTNPYPYMKHCNLYVQPSRYEGYCLTLMEVKSFLKPIITTNVNGVNEQIINGVTGLIVDANKIDLYKAIDTLIRNPSLQKRFSTNLSQQYSRFHNYQDLITSVF